MLIGWILSSVLYLLILVGFVIQEIASGSGSPQFWGMMLYCVGVILLFHIYEIAILLCSYSAIRKDEGQGQGQDLQPIGKGVIYIWEYFANDLKSGAKFFLVSEMVVFCINKKSLLR